MLGGLALLFTAFGLIGVSVMDESTETTVAEDSQYASRIPAAQLSNTATLESISPRAVIKRPSKFNAKKQRTLIMASLRRRENSRDMNIGKDELVMPEWDKIINPGGTLKDDVNKNGMHGSNSIPDFVDLYNGIEAEFIQENISNGVATDMSALLIGSKLSDEVLYNGVVRRAHDLGNAYVLATIGNDEHLRLYAAVERLITDEGTFIEFEFNQSRVHVSSGSPWPIIGQRTDGDILVRMIFSNRTLQSVTFEQWTGSGFDFINTGAGITGDSCLQMREFMYCVGNPPILHPVDGFEVWDEDNNVLEPTFADNFVEVGIDVDLLVGAQINISSVLFRTPEDIAMNNFRVFARAAQFDESFAASTGLIQRDIYTKTFVGGQTH